MMTETVGSSLGAIAIKAGEWKILSKMGEKGWKALIPVYGDYLIYKHAGAKKEFWANFAVNAGVVAAAVTAAVNAGVHVTAAGTLAYTAGSLTTLPVLIPILVGCGLGVVSVALFVRMLHKLSKSFGHGKGYTAGLVFFQPIFDLILGFGESKYTCPEA